jgi:hypothetical protein
MKLAFLILVHRYPAQAAGLIKILLKEKDVTVFVHTDAKADDVFEMLHKEFAGNTQVVFTANRYKVYWGSYNQIKATAELITTAFKHGIYNRYTLLSGQDFPIKPIGEFKKFLCENEGAEFISFFKLPKPGTWGGNGGMNRMEYYWLGMKIQQHRFVFGKINGFTHGLHKVFGHKRKLNFPLYGGGNWFTLSNSAVTYIAQFLEKNPGYLKRFRYTRCADEIFTQSILLNSPFKDKVVNDDLRYVNWSTGPEYPKILRAEDYAILAQAKNKFFARKFDEKIDAKVIEKLSVQMHL